MNRWRVLFGILPLFPAPAAAQGYRARLDLQAQTVSFRGVTLDSVLQSSTVVGTGGGRFTTDGFAVHCPGINGYCFFFRPGPIQRGGPVTATLEATAWGLRVPGLSLHGIARVGGDLGGTDVWPGTHPQAQLLEGHVQYANDFLTAQAGRIQNFSRLGAIGYDGGQVVARSTRFGLEATGYGGFGLARATAIPVNSPVLNPLDQYQPSKRQGVAGATAFWTGSFGSVRLLYQREIERTSGAFTSERSGVDLVVRPPIRGLRASGGADYDIAAGVWGSAEGTLSMARGPVAVLIGARRYRPQFDLWTIWGAFSPVPYHAINALLRISPVRQLALSGRGERYVYDPTDADTPLANFVTDGWRWSANAEITPRNDLDLAATYRREAGPGASSSGFEATGSWHRQDDFWLTLSGASLERPLEFRFDNAKVWMLSLNASAMITSRISVSAGGGHYVENRQRGDAAGFDWNQNRLDLRVRVLFGPGADQVPLPPAVPRTR